MRSWRWAALLILAVHPFGAARGGEPRLEAGPHFFYITAEPSLGTRTFTPIASVRTPAFDRKWIERRYHHALRRTYGKDWFQYAHHGLVHGPFATAGEAKDHFAAQQREASAYAHLKELPSFAWAFYPAGVLFLERRATVPPGRNDPVRSALASLPCLVYDESEVVLPVAGTAPSAPADPDAPSLANLDVATVVVAMDAQSRVPTGFAKELAAVLAKPQGRRVLVVDVGPWQPQSAAVELLGETRAGPSAREVALLQVPAGMTPVEARRLVRSAIRETARLTPPALFINEIMSSNRMTLKDDADQYDDWAEIFNAGTEPIDLAGMYVSNSTSRAARWRIAADQPARTTIPAGGYLVLWLDGDIQQGPTHGPFRLSSLGEELVLIDQDGRTVLDEVVFPMLGRDLSYGRDGDGALAWRVSPGTPGASNRPKGP